MNHSQPPISASHSQSSPPKSEIKNQKSDIPHPLLADLNIPHCCDVPLGPKTWYGVGGSAEVLAAPSSIAQLAALAARCRERRVPMRVLGSGANLLVSDAGVPGEPAVPGVVVELSDPCFRQLTIEGNLVRVGAGYDLFKLVPATARAGLSGLEVVAGIPASVGGAVRMNAGGTYGEIGSSVQRVQVMAEGGQVYYRDRDDLVFGYRRTNIAAPLILEVTFELSEDDPDLLMRRFKEIFLYKKASQPMGASSAGCVFRNPPKDVGATAGQLIDRSGLKGFRIGRAQVSPVHANFVVVDGKKEEAPSPTAPRTGASDVLAVIEHVQEAVQAKTGVMLEREVVVWP